MLSRGATGNSQGAGWQRLVLAIGIPGFMAVLCVMPTPSQAAEKTCQLQISGVVSSSGVSSGVLACGVSPSDPDFKPGANPAKPSPCSWSVASRQEAPPPGSKPGGKWYVRFCKMPGYETYADFEKVMLTWNGMMNTQRALLVKRAGVIREYWNTAPPARPSARDVMLWKAASLPYPTPYVKINEGITRENLQVIYTSVHIWLTDANGIYTPTRFGEASQSVTLSGYKLVWTVVPTMTINPGTEFAGSRATAETGWPPRPNGQPFTCPGDSPPHPDGATTDYNSTYCQAVYGKSGHYQLTASVTWQVNWSADGIPQPPLTGPTKTTTTKVSVAEIQSLVGKAPPPGFN